MTTFSKPPYSSARWSSQFNSHNRREESTEPASAAPIKSVSVVGAVFDRNYNLYSGDIETINRSLKILENANIPLDKKADFHFYNLLAPVNSDFLRAALIDRIAPASDALIVCGVYGRFHPEIVLESMPYYQRDIPYDAVDYMYSDVRHGLAHNREVGVSLLQADPFSWASAANAIGAKIVFTRGGSQDEIGTGNFLKNGFYRAAIDTDEKHEMIYCAVSGSLGIAVHEKAVAELQKNALPGNLLGQRILSFPPPQTA
ncbi:MAG: hypothetical protein DI626_01095 [Micavibrio aeruginosavorus]|uniref:Uncharacterized protein n=1 Tax=Micavibrio aeruginosavorus TaxID=349221 RepID=A0A2W5C3Q6_9BACT|nr:MAG: hypothetical protein DI626_01095 [Micavibrio aeruginosavorus]